MSRHERWFPSHLRELQKAECLQLLAGHQAGVLQVHGRVERRQTSSSVPFDDGLLTQVLGSSLSHVPPQTQAGQFILDRGGSRSTRAPRCQQMSDAANPRTLTPSSQRRNDGDRAVLEQAKGALMLWCGIGSHEAFALLLAWARESNTTLHTIAHTLVHDVRYGDGADHHDPALAKWLHEQLSDQSAGLP